MINDSIIGIYKDLKQKTLDTELCGDVKLVLNEALFPDYAKNIKSRTVLYKPDRAAVGTSGDFVTFNMIIYDKILYDEDSLLQSIANGLLLIRRLLNDVGYSSGEDFSVDNIELGTAVETDNDGNENYISVIATSVEFGSVFVPKQENEIINLLTIGESRLVLGNKSLAISI